MQELSTCGSKKGDWQKGDPGIYFLSLRLFFKKSLLYSRAPRSPIHFRSLRARALYTNVHSERTTYCTLVHVGRGPVKQDRTGPRTSR